MCNEINFIGSFINCYIENDVAIIGIGDNSIKPKNYLIISSLDDSNAIQTHLSEKEVENAIDQITLDGTTFTIDIKTSKISAVHTSKIVAILKDDQAACELLVEYLEDIFGADFKIFE